MSGEHRASSHSPQNEADKQGSSLVEEEEQEEW